MSVTKDEANRQLVRTLVPELSEQEVEHMVARIQAERDARPGDEPSVVTDADAPTWQDTD